MASADDSACEIPVVYATDWRFSRSFASTAMFAGAVDTKVIGSLPPYGSG